MVKTLEQVELFVTRGILPENLPPVFTTERLWDPFAGLGTSYAVTQKVVGEYAIYNSSKRGGQRRLFGIPHPIFVRDQGLFYLKHWSSLSSLMDASEGSASKPMFARNANRLVGVTPHAELPKLRLKRFSRFKFCLVTDVSRFYQSVYTHSIPWVINGKSQAKADTSYNSANVFGNRLDFLLRQTQSRQTVGMPVGPDTSKIAAEIIMSAVDKEFLRLSGRRKPAYLRHIDDICIAGNTKEECDKHLQNITSALRRFQLDINENKTRIVSTKEVLGEAWPFDLVRNLRASLRNWDDVDPVSVMSQIIERAHNDNDEGLVRFTLRKLDEWNLWAAKWNILEYFIAQCAVQFPHSFDYVARVVVWRLRTGSVIDVPLWKDVARLIANQHASLGHDSEVVWALWLLKELKVRLPKSLTDEIVENCGALPLCFLAHAASKNIATDRKLKEKIWSVVDGDLCAGPFWPVTLELAHLGIPEPTWSAKIAKAPPNLRALHDARVSIVAWDALPKVFEPDAENDPEYAIEDYGSDYGEDHTEYWEDDDDDDPLAEGEKSDSDLAGSPTIDEIFKGVF